MTKIFFITFDGTAAASISDSSQKLLYQVQLNRKRLYEFLSSIGLVIAGVFLLLFNLTLYIGLIKLLAAVTGNPNFTKDTLLSVWLFIVFVFVIPLGLVAYLKMYFQKYFSADFLLPDGSVSFKAAKIRGLFLSRGKILVTENGHLLGTVKFKYKQSGRWRALPSDTVLYAGDQPVARYRTGQFVSFDTGLELGTLKSHETNPNCLILDLQLDKTNILEPRVCMGMIASYLVDGFF